eukprot:1010264-Pleurochrysis_carterae.AAC.1
MQTEIGYARLCSVHIALAGMRMRISADASNQTCAHNVYRACKLLNTAEMEILKRGSVGGI